jgi:hypothetical protein
LKNSRRARRSDLEPAGNWLDLLGAGAFLATLSAGALAWFYSHGYLLYFGDAQAHLNHARRIIDSRTPGIAQLGMPWLPVPHLLMLPFVGNDDWWRSGLAGAIPSAVCFVLAGLALYAATRLALGSCAAGATAAALFALNPNMLYLQSIPMTEAVFFASVTGLLLSTIWFGRSQSLAAALATAVLSNAASLTRYEGWIFIPFIAVYILIAGGERRLQAAVLFLAIAALGPLAWIGYNAYYAGNPLEFYNGPYSAKGIYARALRAGMGRYAGDHEWGKAFLYYTTAAARCSGLSLALTGTAGLAAALLRRASWPILLLALPCAFYILSMYSSGTPIFVPGLWPNSYYNTRYGLAALPLLAFGGAAIISLLQGRAAWFLGALLVAVSAAPWILNPTPESWICWKESQVNSESRREWTQRAADYLKAHYQPGTGIFTSFGDLSGIYGRAGIPLRETLYDGNNPEWMVAVERPNLFLHEEWAVGFAGDSVTTAVLKANRKSIRYRLVESIAVKNAAVIEIYKRN